ncbi:HmuY family protein [Rhodothermus marinus]|uniref:HmuY family protein n=1 Tax=Rhodothermus marinus TaxID=29549 RepID=UPI000AF4016A|nr:HmuY family protein [Rhodothermus marinus]
MPTRTFLLLSLTLVLLLAACDSSEPLDETTPVEAVRVEDLPADPTTPDPQTGRPVGTGRYTFFSLRTGEIVLRYDEPDRSDSASTAWDLAFQGTNILINGGTSGPGQGGAVVLEVPFDEVTEAPTDDQFRVDGVDECPNGVKRAICPGSGNGWYNYDPTTHIVTPIPGRTIVVRTADGRYARCGS